MSLFYDDQRLRAPHFDQAALWAPRDWDARTNIDLGGGTMEARYAVLNDNTCWFTFVITLDGSTVPSFPAIYLPFTPVRDGIGPAVFHNTGTRIYPGNVRWAAANIQALMTTEMGFIGSVTNTTPTTWGDTDVFIGSGIYEVAL